MSNSFPPLVQPFAFHSPIPKSDHPSSPPQEIHMKSIFPPRHPLGIVDSVLLIGFQFFPLSWTSVGCLSSFPCGKDSFPPFFFFSSELPTFDDSMNSKNLILPLPCAGLVGRPLFPFALWGRRRFIPFLRGSSRGFLPSFYLQLIPLSSRRGKKRGQTPFPIVRVYFLFFPPLFLCLDGWVQIPPLPPFRPPSPPVRGSVPS